MYPEQNIEEQNLTEPDTNPENEVPIHPMQLSYEGRITEVEEAF